MIFLNSFLAGTLLMAALTNPVVPSRQLLIFGKEAHSATLAQQLQILNAAKTGLAERDVKIIVVEKTDPLIKKYAVKPAAFAVILIGKDGGEKFRTNELLPVQQLFALIDSMPMRREEIKTGKSR